MRIGRFASESCIPIRRFDEVYDALVAARKSWIKSKPCPERAGGIETRIIPPQHLMKSSQWIALNLADAQAVVDQCPTEGFREVFAADELFAATTLAMAGRDMATHVSTRQLTYAQWQPVDASPASFDRVDHSHFARVRASECLFARKYLEQSNVGQFETRLLSPAEDTATTGNEP